MRHSRPQQTYLPIPQLTTPHTPTAQATHPLRYSSRSALRTNIDITSHSGRRLGRTGPPATVILQRARRRWCSSEALLLGSPPTITLLAWVRESCITLLLFIGLSPLGLVSISPLAVTLWAILSDVGFRSSLGDDRHPFLSRVLRLVYLSIAHSTSSITHSILSSTWDDTLTARSSPCSSASWAVSDIDATLARVLAHFD